MLADCYYSRRRAVKRWLVSDPDVDTTRLAEASSANVAYGLLATRGADLIIMEATMKRTEDEFPAELGRAIAELKDPPRLILYDHHSQNGELLTGITTTDFQLNAALAHAYIDLRRPDAPARLVEAVKKADKHLLFLST